MDWRSFLVGWGVGVISWWAQGAFVQRLNRRKMNTLFEQLARADVEHKAGRRCEFPQCDYCNRPQDRPEGRSTNDGDTLNAPHLGGVSGDRRDA